MSSEPKRNDLGALPLRRSGDATDTTLRAGAVVGGKYRVERLLGRGGMGEVYLAFHQQLGRPVAIKVLRDDAARDPGVWARFQREAMAASRLASTHIAEVFDVGELGPREDGVTPLPYMVMEYLHGRDLAAHLDERGALGIGEVVDLLTQICEGVRVAHAAGIVHRDLKPANLFLVQRRGQSALLKILDFGIAKATRGIVANDTTHGHALARPVGVTQLTGYGGMLGSARYMAPEQMESARDVDGRADIWAIGVIGYKLLTGEAPFHADTHEELFVAMLTRPFAPLAARRPDAPPALVAAIEGCLRPAREDRWPTVDALAATLTRALPVHRSTPVVRPSARRGPAAPLAAPFSSAGFGLALLAVGAAIAVAASGAAVVVLLLLVVLPALFPASAATSSGSGVGAAKDPLELLPQAKAAAMARMPGVSLVAIKITSHATAPFRVEDGLPQFFFGRAGTTVWTLVSFDSLGMHVSDFTSPSALPASIEPRCSFEAAKRSAVAAGHVPAAVELDNYGSSARNAWTFQAVGGGAIGPIFEVDGATCAVKRK